MTSFEYYRPETVEETCELLAQHGPEARVMAGGTALTILLKERLLDASHLISLDRLPLQGVAWRDGVLEAGATVPLQVLASNPLVLEHLPIVSEVVSLVASRRIRNVATVGGNLCWAEPASDPPGLFTALGAEAVIRSTNGERVVPLREFFSDYFTTILEPDELLTGVRIPAPPAGSGVAYIKFTPQSQADKPVLGVTALVRRAPDGSCAEARFVIGAAGPTPLSLPEADAELLGSGPDGAAVKRLVDRYAEEARPVSDSRGSETYKRAMIRELMRRALAKAWERAGAAE